MECLIKAHYQLCLISCVEPVFKHFKPYDKILFQINFVKEQIVLNFYKFNLRTKYRTLYVVIKLRIPRCHARNAVH